jgi:hypothetical protein
MSSGVLLRSVCVLLCFAVCLFLCFACMFSWRSWQLVDSQLRYCPSVDLAPGFTQFSWKQPRSDVVPNGQICLKSGQLVFSIDFVCFVCTISLFDFALLVM